MTARAHARLFLALWPTAPVRTQLAQHRDAWRWPAKAAPVRDDKLHLTLHFIGDVERTRLDDLRLQFRVPFEPFALELGWAGLWPHGIATLQPRAIPPALAELQQGLGGALRHLGLPVDAREFRPHVTLARRAHGAESPAQEPVVGWQVDSYVLVESEFDAGRSYTIVERYAS